MSLTPEDRERNVAILRKACEQLGETFDTVQIFVTRHEAGEHDGTINIHYGSGNWFARYGQVKNWMIRADEQERNTTREQGV